MVLYIFLLFKQSIKMKKTNAILIFILTLLVFASCGRKSEVVTPSESNVATQVSHRETNEWTIERVFEVFEHRSTGTFYSELPEGYVPSKLGEWNYSRCYLFVRNSGGNIEFYTFPDEQSYKNIGPGCGEELFTCQPSNPECDTPDSCMPDGSSCHTNADGNITVRCPN